MEEKIIIGEITKLLGVSSEEIMEALGAETEALKKVMEAATLEEIRIAFYACPLRSKEGELALAKWAVLGIVEAQRAVTVREATKAFFGSFMGSEGRKRAIRKIATLLDARYWSVRRVLEEEEQEDVGFVRSMPLDW